MLKDITLGQYYHASSPIHRLDPRTKLFGTLMYLIILFVNRNFVGLGLMGLLLFILIRLARVPFSYMTRGLRSIWLLILFTSMVNLFFTKTGTVVFSWWVLTITTDGLSRMGFMTIRIILLIMCSSLMTLTTTPNDLTDGLEKGLRFLKVLHIPVGAIAMMMSIALRFIPILTEEADKIMKAQLSRGAAFGEGGLIKRAKSYLPLLVPLIISAFRRALDLANAMEARCYRVGEERTRLHPLMYHREDYIAYLLILAALAGIVALGFFIPPTV